MPVVAMVNRVYNNLASRYRCLEETWQRGYTWSYRWFRFREAFELRHPLKESLEEEKK